MHVSNGTIITGVPVKDMIPTLANTSRHKTWIAKTPNVFELSHPSTCEYFLPKLIFFLFFLFLKNTNIDTEISITFG